MATRYRVTCTECPFDRTYSSQGKADHAHARHSCERHQRLAADRARGEARMAAIDRTPKPCLHKEASHQHGTYACYVLDHCRCVPCAEESSRYDSDRLRQKAYGRWNGLVDAEPARLHIRELTSHGMGLKRIVAVSGIAHGVLWKLMYGKTRPDGTRTPSVRITPHAETRILAVRLDLADGARVDSTGAARRIQALVALGWSQAKIAARLGILPSNFTGLTQGRTAITVAHDKAVRALYDEWSMQLPPQAVWRDKIAASRSRNYAKAAGWLPPLAWDDEALDDPEAVAIMPTASTTHDVELDESAIYRRMHGDKTVRLSKADAVELVARCVAAGWFLKDIEKRTGVKPERYRQAGAA